MKLKLVSKRKNNKGDREGLQVCPRKDMRKMISEPIVRTLVGFRVLGPKKIIGIGNHLGSSLPLVNPQQH